MRGYCTRGRLLSSGCSRQISIVHGNGPTCKVCFCGRAFPRLPRAGGRAKEGRAVSSPVTDLNIRTLHVSDWEICSEGFAQSRLCQGPARRELLTGTKPGLQVLQGEEGAPGCLTSPDCHRRRGASTSTGAGAVWGCKGPGQHPPTAALRHSSPSEPALSRIYVPEY